MAKGPRDEGSVVLAFPAMLSLNGAPKRLPVTLLGMTYPGPKTCNDDPL